jgi:hypothetical protein
MWNHFRCFACVIRLSLHVTLLDFIIVIIFDVEYELWVCYLRHILNLITACHVMATCFDVILSSGCLIVLFIVLNYSTEQARQ